MTCGGMRKGPKKARKEKGSQIIAFSGGGRTSAEKLARLESGFRGKRDVVFALPSGSREVPRSKREMFAELRNLGGKFRLIGF